MISVADVDDLSKFVSFVLHIEQVPVLSMVRIHF